MSDSTEKRKRASIAAVFWIVLALILLIVFLVNQDNIVRILKETDFFVHVFGEQPAFIENYDLPAVEEEREDDIIFAETSEKVEQNISETIQLQETISSAPPVVPVVTTEDTQNETKEPSENVAAATKPVEQKQSVTSAPITSQQHLYFVFVNGDGTVERKESVRSVPKSTTPLTASIKALLEGPNSDDKNKGYVSFIPKGTRLLSASIQDGTALINLSEEFSFNQYGVEGYLAQLMQVVYTATAFNTIKNVRFFIEGEQSSYLGNDGVWIGAPLSRTDFK